MAKFGGYGPFPMDYAVAQFLQRVGTEEDQAVLNQMQGYSFSREGGSSATITVTLFMDQELLEFGKVVMGPTEGEEVKDNG